MSRMWLVLGDMRGPYVYIEDCGMMTVGGGFLSYVKTSVGAGVSWVGWGYKGGKEI